MKSSKHSTSNGGTTGGPSDVDLVAPEILFEHDMARRSLILFPPSLPELSFH
jgi:hypothetical protein